MGLINWFKRTLGGSGLAKRNEMSCYHAKKRKDCSFYQRGSCTCSYSTGTTINGVPVDIDIVDK